MSAPKIRKNDQGTAYATALLSGARTGMSRCTDAEVMAHFCEYNLQLLVGAVSPRLVWEGAQKRHMTALELARLADKGWQGVDNLQWS